MFSQGALPFEFKNLEETLRVTNTNLVFYQCLSMINQHVPFDFEYLIFPQRYEKEWRTILCLLIDFARFKRDYAERHYELVQESQNVQTMLSNLSIELNMTIDRKAQLETRRSEMAQEEQRMIFMLEEMGVEVEEM